MMRAARRWMAVAVLVAASAPVHLAAQSPGDEVEVTAATATIRDGTATLTTVPRGGRLVVKAANPPWLQVDVVVGGRSRGGWILASDVRAVQAAAAPDGRPARRWVRVTAERADVKVGQDVVGVARRGEIYEVIETRDGWRLIEVERDGRRERGYLAPGTAADLPAADVGPGTAGRVPASIQSPTVSVDWATADVTLGVRLPLRDDAAELRLVGAGADDVGPAGVLPTAGAAGIRVPWAVLRDCIVPDTRSVWVAEGADRWHRLDLPEPRVAATLQGANQDAAADAVVLTLSATNVLPGFVVEQRESIADGAWSAPEPIRRAAGFAPRLVETSGTAAEARIRTSFASRGKAGQSTATRVEFTVLGPDGSRSNAVQFARRGDEVQRAGRTVAAGVPAAVDVTTRAPAVELLAWSQAERRVRAAGLVPLVAAGPAAVPDALVLRQGLEPGTPVLRGSVMLLDCAADLAAAATPRPTVAGIPPVDAGDDFGFVDVRTPGSGADAADRAAVEAALASSLVAEARAAAVALAVDPDPGIVIDPGLDAAAVRTAATLKTLVRTLERQATPDHLPGPIGRSLTDVIEAHDDAWQDLLLDGGATAADLPVDEAIRALERNVRLSIGRADRQRAVADWRRFASRRRTPADLDRNRNGVVADDVVIWSIAWLCRNGLYDVAEHATFATSGGLPALVVADEPIRSGADRPGPLPLVLPGAGGAAAGPAPQGGAAARPVVAPLAAADVAALAATVPAGPPLVTGSESPRQVRVPDLREQAVAAADTRLRERGLGIAAAGDLFATDRVVSSDPAAAEWMAPGKDVRLEVLRTVPDAVQLSQAQARGLLERWGLEAVMRAGDHPRDIVTAQVPAAGEFVAVGASVELTSRVLVPHVVGMRQREAVAAFETADLTWKADTKAFAEDKVVAQDPPAGALADHGDAIGVVVHVAVPALAGATLERARTMLETADLEAAGGDGRAFGRDIVRGQRPAAGTFVPHGSVVTLGPVVGRVPDVRGLGIRAAERLLNDRENYDTNVVDADTLRGDDLVTAQNPPPDAELERGKVVTLDARVGVPDLVGQALDVAQDALDRSPGGLSLVVRGRPARADVVFAQEPRPGILVAPRTVVSVVPGVSIPEVEGRDVDAAVAILRRAGLDGRVVASATRPTTARALIGRTVVETQRPAAGILPRAQVGVVELVVVEYVFDEVEVPDVVTMPWRDAVAELRDAGLVPVVVNEAGDRQTPEEFERGKSNLEYSVTDMEPARGTRVRRGSSVVITVYY